MPIEIPKPGKGIPTKLRPWLEQLRQQILTARGVAGKHVSINVHPGKGTVYNVNRVRPVSALTCAEAITGDIEDVSITSTCFASPIPQSFYHHTEWGSRTLSLDSQPDYYPTGSCLWFFLASGGVDGYVGNHDFCDEGSDDGQQTLLTVARFSGIWYAIQAVPTFAGGISPVLFYADNFNPASPVPNSLVSYSSTYNDATLPSSDFMDYWNGDGTPGSGDQSWTVIGDGGTLNITL